MNPTASIPAGIEYPETDGLPMAENTKQFRWIVTIKEGIQFLFRDRDDVFVAGDLFWYPVQGHPEIRTAPDTLVVFGRPPGDRGSYKQWEEGGIAPQVVFEVLSPGNTALEMRNKLAFYERYGVVEYYLYDPDDNELEGWIRDGAELVPIGPMPLWTSPRLGLRFDWDEGGLRLLRPDGRPLETYEEIGERAETERQRAETAEQRAETAEQRATRLAERLRALGIDPDA
ncbi:MAG: Uma2 family endonuclease [Isosphaeraceae bacterium]